MCTSSLRLAVFKSCLIPAAAVGRPQQNRFVADRQVAFLVTLRFARSASVCVCVCVCIGWLDGKRGSDRCLTIKHRVPVQLRGEEVGEGAGCEAGIYFVAVDVGDKKPFILSSVLRLPTSTASSPQSAS